jgi:hypothetical protein
LALHGAGFGKFRIPRQEQTAICSCGEKSSFPPRSDTDSQHICLDIRCLGAFVKNEGNKVGSFRNAYHPERHYMRGPGPKWHAKHTASLVAAASVQPAAGAVMPRPATLSSQHIIMTWIAPTAAAAALGFMAVMVLA